MADEFKGAAPGTTPATAATTAAGAKAEPAATGAVPTFVSGGPGVDADRDTSAEVTESPSARDSLRFDLTRNGFYHSDRERHFGRIHRWSMFFVVATGTASFGAAMGEAYPTLAPVIAALTALTGLLDLVFDISGKAREHSALRRQCFSLLGELSCGGDASAIRKNVYLMCGEEPVSNETVDAVAYNATILALGRDRREMFEIGRWRHFFRHWRYSGHDLRTFAEKCEESPAMRDR